MVAAASIASCLELHNADYLWEQLVACEPRTRQKRLAWAKENITNEHGRDYDHSSYPHIGAPGGPMDSADDDHCRTIAMQWATRLGKSFFGQCESLYTADVEPAPMLMVSSVEKLAVGVMRRTYKMIRKNERIRRKLARHERLQQQALIEFWDCDLAAGWSGSVSTLSDRDVKVGHANEIDKWEYPTTAVEADPLKLFDDRHKNHWSTRKVIYESTPTVQGHSRIERLLLSGTNCRYYVPCPHCKQYQPLEFGNGTGEKGCVVWDKTDDKLAKADLARRTAVYVCGFCGERIGNERRPWMMQHGVWVPNGATVDHEAALAITDADEPPDWDGWENAGWIATGAPNSNEAASYQLGSLYALTLTWGDYAAEFVSCHGKPELLRNWVNQWEGRTWQVRKVNHEWEDVAKRLAGKHKAGVMPDECGFLTLGIDVQADVYVWCLMGWGLDDRGYLVDYGKELTWETMRGVLDKLWPGETLAPRYIAAAGIDSGNNTDAIYKHCREYQPVGKPKHLLKPTKGFDSQEKPVIPSGLESSENKERQKELAASGMRLWRFHKPYFQEWLQVRLDAFSAGQPDSICIPATSINDRVLIEDLMNNAFAPNERGRMTWAKIKEGEPDDYRDALVISRVMRHILVSGNERRVAEALAERKLAGAVKPPPKLPGLDGGDGPFLITDR